MIGFAGTASALAAGWCWGQSIPWPATSAPTPSLHSHCTMQHTHDKHTQTHMSTHTHTPHFNRTFTVPVQISCWTAVKCITFSSSAGSISPSPRSKLEAEVQLPGGWRPCMHGYKSRCAGKLPHTHKAHPTHNVLSSSQGSVSTLGQFQQISNQKFWSHIFSATNLFTPSDIPCLQQSTKANHPQHPAVGTSNAETEVPSADCQEAGAVRGSLFKA